MAFIVFPIVLLIGYFILDAQETSADWKIPWLIYGAASVLVFINSMTLSFIEGCDSVGDVQKIRFQISVVTFFTSLVLLISGASLYALSLSLLAGALAGSAIILHRYKRMLYQLHRQANNKTHPWAKEIIPLIWRFAISWISGYFIFSIFTPLTFHYYGAIEAGKVGISMAACMAIFNIASIWIIKITPKINIYVAKENYLQLKSIFKKHLFLSVLTYILGIISLYLVINFEDGYIPINNRLLSNFSILILSTANLFQLIINSMAIYIRAHKKEPLVVVSVLTGLYVAITTYLIVTNMPFEYLFLGSLSAYIVTLPWVYSIFKKYDKTSQ
ncbi:hypothetical protein [Pseudomonas piscis]|uniref:hypothetical protein n=1 Tax=Pseudomonas piscis TaxID=2614538 RepID=UPI001F3FBA23|nr:hypothetical protein [Pseudomonas piscis]